MNESPYVLDQDFTLEFKKVKKIRKKVREALEKYCELDTLAEVKIVEKLCDVVGN